jgi:hypothetical protein
LIATNGYAVVSLMEEEDGQEGGNHQLQRRKPSREVLAGGVLAAETRGRQHDGRRSEADLGEIGALRRRWRSIKAERGGWLRTGRAREERARWFP